MTDTSAKLNPIELVEAISKQSRNHLSAPNHKTSQKNSGQKDDTTRNTSGATNTDNNKTATGNTGANSTEGQQKAAEENTTAGIEKLNELVDQAERPGDIYALIQYVSMNTDSVVAKTALRAAASAFKSLNKTEISSGTANMAKYTKGLKLSGQEVKTLVNMLASKMPTSKAAGNPAPAKKPAAEKTPVVKKPGADKAPVAKKAAEKAPAKK
jgi:hypothetical protein